MLSFAVSALSLNLSPAVSRSANPVMAWQPMQAAPLADQALALDADTKDAIIELGLVREVRVPARAAAIDLSESVDPIEMGLVRFLRMPQRSRPSVGRPTPRRLAALLRRPVGRAIDPRVAAQDEGGRREVAPAPR